MLKCNPSLCNVFKNVTYYFTWQWPHPMRPASSCEPGLIKPKLILDCQPFGLTTGDWPRTQTAGPAVPQFMSAWTLYPFFTKWEDPACWLARSFCASMIVWRKIQGHSICGVWHTRSELFIDSFQYETTMVKVLRQSNTKFPSTLYLTSEENPEKTLESSNCTYPILTQSPRNIANSNQVQGRYFIIWYIIFNNFETHPMAAFTST